MATRRSTGAGVNKAKIAALMHKLALSACGYVQLNLVFPDGDVGFVTALRGRPASGEKTRPS